MLLAIWTCLTGTWFHATITAGKAEVIFWIIFLVYKVSFSYSPSSFPLLRHFYLFSAPPPRPYVKYLEHSRLHCIVRMLQDEVQVQRVLGDPADCLLCISLSFLFLSLLFFSFHFTSFPFSSFVLFCFLLFYLMAK